MTTLSRTLIAASLAVCVAPRAVAEQNPHLARGIELLDRAEDEQALKAFREALRWQGNGRADRARIQVYLGITRLNLADEERARGHFRAAFKLDATVELPPGVSPKIGKVAEEVRTEVAAQPPARVTQPIASPAPAMPVVRRRAGGSAWTYWPAWTVLGVGLAAGGTGLALGLRARSKADEAADLGLPTGVAESKHDTAKKMALTANILFGVAGAAAAVAGVLFYVGSRRSTASAGIVPLEGGALVQVHGVAW